MTVMTNSTRATGLVAVGLGLGLGLVLGGGLGCGWKLETRDAQPPASSAQSAPRAVASAFSLPNDDGSFVSLDDLLAEGRPAVLVFYRGHW